MKMLKAEAVKAEAIKAEAKQAEVKWVCSWWISNEQEIATKICLFLMSHLLHTLTVKNRLKRELLLLLSWL